MMKFISVLLVCGLASSVHASVRTYFNHNPASQYTDPYRNITRSGDNLEQVIIDNIRSAKESVYLAVMELRLPLVAQALIEKKRQGLDVRVVLEHNYNFSILTQPDSEEQSENQYEASKLAELKALVDLNKNGRYELTELETRDAIYMLKRAGITILDDTSDASRGAGLMHHKFLIVDERKVVFGSANYTLSCIHGDILEPRSRGNANSLIVVESKTFTRFFVQEFMQLWGNGRRGNYGHGKSYRGPQTATVDGMKLTVQFSPTSRRFQWEESVNGLIAEHLKKARESVQAALFVYSDQNLGNMMEPAERKGAQVGVLVEPNFAYRYYSELLDMWGLTFLNSKCVAEPDNRPWKRPVSEAGTPRLNPGDVLHHKFAVVDNKTVIVGSQNWSDAANYLNDETLVVIEGSAISDGYTQEYERLRSRSVMGAPAFLIDQIQEQHEACEGIEP